MLDSIDYAANAGVIPAIACMGEKDVFFQAHVIIGEAMEREGLKMVNLISPGTGHVIDPVTHADQMRRIGELADKGLAQQPGELRFVTWTLKYSRCHWLQLLGLESHYDRAEIVAQLRDDSVEISKATNITRFAVLTSQLPAIPKTIRVERTDLRLPDSITSMSSGVVVVKTDRGWSIAGELGRTPLAGKRPGLQGPIDDAFTSRFICVRGTGQPWNAAVQSYAEASLKRFAQEWRQYFRGDLPIKDDTAVTYRDLRTCNLILFGDGGSTRWIAQALPKLPLKWSAQTLKLAGRDYDAASHVPALVAPNPLPGGEEHYLVLNSGHTFREAELAKLNYLLFPRWGDWAALQIDPPPGKAPVLEKVVQAGYFNERWK